MNAIQNRVAIVTGAGSGLGRGMALAFSAEGAAVTVADLDGESVAETLSMVEAAGGRGFASALDVASPRDVQRMVDETVETMGTVDILVNSGQRANRTGAGLLPWQSPPHCQGAGTAHRLRRRGGGVQDSGHRTAQTLRHAMGAAWRASHSDAALARPKPPIRSRLVSPRANVSNTGVLSHKCRAHASSQSSLIMISFGATPQETIRSLGCEGIRFAREE